MSKDANTPSKGNASNKSPQQDGFQNQGNDLFAEKAETYLREGGNIEDMPDPAEEEDAENPGNDRA
jgi:hypothetical protein